MAEAVAGAQPAVATPLTRQSVARLLAVGVPAALLLGAFASQYLGRLYPCEMCWWQRYAHMVALVPALIAISPVVGGERSRPFVLLAALAIAVSGAIAVYHAGVEYKIFEGFTTCTSTAGGGSAELWKRLAAAPLVRCDQVQWSIFGISLAGFNAIISLGSAALIAALTLSGWRR